MRCTKSLIGAVVYLAAYMGGCALGASEEVQKEEGVTATLSFEEFAALAELEPFEGGVYIIDGDLTAEDEHALHELYVELVQNPTALSVATSRGRDLVWNATDKRNLTYCVSDSFGSLKSRVVDAMREAADEWEQAADIDFVYVPSEDSRCTATNENVLFDVRPAGDASYAARAFFPGQSRRTRNILIADNAFNPWSPLVGILRHELGHALGFLHEHLRTSACPEGGQFRQLTEYDPGSVMHYPECGGTNFRLELSNRDIVGARTLYGAPASAAPPTPTDPAPTDPDPTQPDPTQPEAADPEPVPSRPTGEPRTGSATGSLSRGQSTRFAPLQIVGGTELIAILNGSGDADLYVRFDAAPTRATFDCRPYLDSANEQCRLRVPETAREIHILVDGYTAADYALQVDWVAPTR